MIKNWILTGDTHGGTGTITRLENIKANNPECKPEETAIIILGEVGFNYYKNKKDWKAKHQASKFGYTLYCLRGNHEDRAENIKNIKYMIDGNVGNAVTYEEEFPNIRYFMDFPAAYEINGYSVLTIPGAYSVDKWYRLQNNWMWFPEEQINAKEMEVAEQSFKDWHFDFVLSHTCPASFAPVDLFLNCIDQSTVDKSMENWMDKFKDMISWGVWCFGHYHADRIEQLHVEQFYLEYKNINDVWNRWKHFDETGELDWWLPKSPAVEDYVNGTAS